MATKLEPKNPKKSPKNFICVLCDYECSNKKDYTKHLNTRKHKNRTDRTEKEQKSPEVFSCPCGKVYKARNSLWYHQKKCLLSTEYQKPEIPEKVEKVEKVENDELGYKGMIHTLIQQNTELQNMLVDQQKEHRNQIQEILPKIGNTTNNTTNNFNLNIFLNEQCKDAMNIMDFVRSLQICSADLENTGKLGYSEGMSQIIIKGLKDLDLHERPVHCSNIKQEILYVKDNDQWTEDADKSILKNAIDHVDKESTKHIHTYLEEKQDTNDDTTNVVCQILTKDNEQEKDSIIKKLAKEVVL